MMLSCRGPSYRTLRRCVLQRPGTRAFAALAPQRYDVAVVGGGPGGYVAAIKAAQLGKKTVCIEKRGTLGGTCLNVGCIPSKALLNITHKYHEAVHDFPRMGIKFMTENGSATPSIMVDVQEMQAQKDRAVKGLTVGIEMLFKMNKVDYKKGTASFQSPNQLSVAGLDGGETEEIQADNIVIATGSVPAPMPGGAPVIVDEEVILSSTGALKLQKVPKKMVVIGGGVIGLELGSVYQRLGTEVVVVEFLDRIAPTLDTDISKSFQKILEKQGFQFSLCTKVLAATVVNDGAGAHVEVENTKTGKREVIECEKVLLAVGRRPHTDGLGLEKLGIKTTKTGQIPVNEQLRVEGHSHIYAIGDCTNGPMLAHKAEEEGIAAAETIAGKPGHVNYDAIPAVIYTHPEVATVGRTEDQLKQDGISYTKGTFPFAANSRARTNDDCEGQVKILTEKATDKILGATVFGPMAGELIQQLVLGLEYGASSEDIARTCHAHPTLSEAVKEACLAAHARPIHGAGK